MIKVDIVEPSSAEWLDWKERCIEATETLTAHWSPGVKLAFNTALYSEMKRIMLGFFHGKCAYCEALITTDQHGDVEHFRPKGAVTDDDHQPVNIHDSKGNFYPHPGYFWLAYEWTNLLPSCVLCNQPSTDKNGKQGKRNRFPVRFHNIMWPQDPSAEGPLLINPMLVDPALHFQFDQTTGRLIGITDEGKKCDEVFNLNGREGIMEARRDVYDAVLARLGDALEARKNDNIKKIDQHVDFILRHKRGEAEYAVAGRKAIADHVAILAAHLNQI